MLKLASSTEEAEDMADEIGYPVRIAPTDGRLPQFVVSRRSEVKNAFVTCLNITNPVGLEPYVRP